MEADGPVRDLAFSALSHCSKPIVLVSDSLECLYVNAAARSLIGPDADKFEGLPEPVRLAAAHAVQKGAEARSLLHDARGLRSLCVTAYPSSGGAVMIELSPSTTANSVSESLAVSDSELGEAISCVGLGWLTTDRAGKILSATESFGAMLGYRLADLTGRELAALAHPEDAPAVGPSVCTPSEYPAHLEARFLTHTGETVWVSAAGAWVRGSQAEPATCIWVAHDVTNRRLAEQQLRESEWRFRSIVENMEDTVTILHADGAIAYRNPAAEQLFGYPPEEFVGKSTFDFMHVDDIEAARRDWARLMGHYGSTHRLEVRVRTKAGEWRWMEAAVSNLLHNPVIAGVLVVGRDITERMQVRRRFRDYATEQESRNRELLSALSHAEEPANPAWPNLFMNEMRTPLEGIRAMSELLLQTSLAGVQKDAVSRMRDSAAHLISLVELLGAGAAAESRAAPDRR